MNGHVKKTENKLGLHETPSKAHLKYTYASPTYIEGYTSSQSVSCIEHSILLNVGSGRHGVMLYCKIRCRCRPVVFSDGCSKRFAY